MSLQASADHSYLRYDMQEISDTAALTRDDNYYLPEDLGQRLFTVYPIDAARLAVINLRRARSSLSVQLTIKPAPTYPITP